LKMKGSFILKKNFFFEIIITFIKGNNYFSKRVKLFIKIFKLIEVEFDLKKKLFFKSFSKLPFFFFLSFF